MHPYNTAAFILQWEHFVAIRGKPKWVHSDLGSQLKKAAHYISDCILHEGKVYGNISDKDNNKELEITALVKEEARRGTTWKICPTQSQWQNGLAEQAVRALKDTLRQVTTGSSLNFAELFCLLQKIANTINDRPLGL